MEKNIILLTDSNFIEKTQTDIHEKNKLFLIDFWAEWCMPCRTMEKILEKISIYFGDKLNIAKLNIDNNPIITQKYNIRSIPTLLLIKNKNILFTKVGIISQQELEKCIQKFI